MALIFLIVVFPLLVAMYLYLMRAPLKGPQSLPEKDEPLP